MSDELKPCPFCGHAAELIFDDRTRGYRYKVACTHCEVQTEGSAFQNDEFNTNQWNKRVSDA